MIMIYDMSQLLQNIDWNRHIKAQITYLCDNNFIFE